MAKKKKAFGIDEDLWFGNYSDAEAEKKAAESVAAMVGRVVGAKPFPVAAHRLAEVTRNANCDINDVVRILERDLALSTKVLRLVNSASFALRVPCTSVRHAAALVGVEKLNQVATTAAILDMYDASSLHASRILEHASVVAGLARYLAAHLGLPTDELFTIGFLHDIGKLMLLDCEPERYGELLDDTEGEFDTIHLYERELFGFDHALLAGHVLSAWSIPDPVPKVVAWHHHVTRAYDEGQEWASLVSVLRLADALSYSLAAEYDEEQVERIARTEAASYLDISAAQLAAIWDELRTLHDRSRALFRGEPPPEPLVPVSLRPSTRSLRSPASRHLQPSHASLRAPESASSLHTSSTPPALQSADRITQSIAVPQQYACIVCKGPSFANTCCACKGYVCPTHLTGAEQWCDHCWQEYEIDGHNWRLRPIVSLIGGAGLGATIVGAFFGSTAGTLAATLVLTLGPLIGTLLAIGLAAIAHRGLRRVAFLRSRPDRGEVAQSVAVKGPSSVPDSGVRPTGRAPAMGAAVHATLESTGPQLDGADSRPCVGPAPLIPTLKDPPRIELKSDAPRDSWDAPALFTNPPRHPDPTLKMFPERDDGPSLSPRSTLPAESVIEAFDEADSAPESSTDVSITREAPAQLLVEPRETNEDAPSSPVPYVRPLVASDPAPGENGSVRPLLPSGRPPARPNLSEAASPSSATDGTAASEPVEGDDAWRAVLGSTGTADGW